MANDFARLARRVSDLPDDIEESATDAVEESLETTQQLARANLRSNDTNWRHVLSQSITVDKDDATNEVSLVVNAPHGGYVEFGTGPQFGSGQLAVPEGVRPFDAPAFSAKLAGAIQNWVDTKPVHPKNPNYDRDELGVVIARHISHAGTSAQPFLRPAWVAMEPILKHNVRSAVRKEVRRL